MTQKEIEQIQNLIFAELREHKGWDPTLERLRLEIGIQIYPPNALAMAIFSFKPTEFLCLEDPTCTTPDSDGNLREATEYLVNLPGEDKALIIRQSTPAAITITTLKGSLNKANHAYHPFPQTKQTTL